MFIYLLLRQMATIHSYTNSNVHSYTEIKNRRNREIIGHKSQVHRHGKWIPNQFSDRAVWLFDSFGNSTLYKLHI